MKRMQSLFAALVVLFAAGQSIGQDRIPVELKATQFTVNVLEPAVMFENKLTDKTSVVVSAGLTTLGFYDSNINNNPKVTLNPFLRAGFRNYYMRKKQKKELNFNSETMLVYLEATISGRLRKVTNLEYQTPRKPFTWEVFGVFKETIKAGFTWALVLVPVLQRERMRDLDLLD